MRIDPVYCSDCCDAAPTIDENKAPKLRIRLCRKHSATDDLITAIGNMQKAVEELLTEFVSKKRAAKWDIINNAGVAAQSAIAKSGAKA